MMETSEINLDSVIASEVIEEEDLAPQGNRFQWVVPLIEGIPPAPRGGHTATKVGRFLIIFGVC
jgi:hypothetical protein